MPDPQRYRLANPRARGGTHRLASELVPDDKGSLILAADFDQAHRIIARLEAEIRELKAQLEKARNA